MKKTMFKVCLATTMALSMQPVWSVGTSLFKSLTTEALLNQKMTQLSVDKAAKTVVESNIKNALEAFSRPGRQVSLQELKSLKFLITDSDDKKIFEGVIKTLEKESATVSSEEVVEMSGQLAILAQRYGLNKVGVLSCLKCANTDIAGQGVTYRLQNFKTQAHEYIYKKELSKRRKPQDMLRFINQELSSQNLGRLTSLPKHEESSLAFFLSIPKYADGETKGFKSLYDSIIKVSKKGESANLFDSKNQHKLWLLANEVESVNEAESLARLLNDVAEEMQAADTTAKEAFTTIMQRKVASVKNPELKSKLEVKLKSFMEPNCYF